MEPEYTVVVRQIVPVLERLGVVYWVGGSLASTVYGEYRSTNDVDFVAYLKDEHVEALVNALQSEFYIDDESVRDAIASQSSFNAIHLDTSFKADFFVVADTPWKQQEASRRVKKNVGTEQEPIIAEVASPEDTILQKLLWFRMGGEVSERQWRDVQGMLKVQQPNLDYGYLQRWASELALADLLEQALDAAHIRDGKETV